MMFDEKSKGIAQAYLNMLEAAKKKPAMDPVGKHDADIDNDGDKDSSDAYLIKRRAAISKSVKEDKVDEASCGSSYTMKSAKKEAIEIAPAGKSDVKKNGMMDKDGGDEEEDEDMNDDEIEVSVKKDTKNSDKKSGMKSEAIAFSGSHQGKTTIKHIKNPSVQDRMAAHDIKPGIAGYRDRIDLLKSAKAQGKLKEEAEEKFDPLKHVKNPTPGEKKAAKDVKRSSYADRAAMLRSAQAGGRLKEASAGSAYAIGMDSAMKSTGDNPPLEKSTIKKAHKIAKGILKKESTVWNWDEILDAPETEIDALIENLDGEDLETFMAEFNELTEAYSKAPPNETTVKTGKEQLIPRAQAEKAFVDMHTQANTVAPYDKDQHSSSTKQAPTRPGDKRASEPLKTLKDIRK